MIPAPTPIIIAVLAGLADLAADIAGGISVKLIDPLPALRVTKVGDQETPSAASIAPLYQIEVWAADELDAERIAWKIADLWPSSRRETVRDATVYGRWVEVLPRPSADPETGHARYLLTVGLRLSGVSA